MSLDTLPRRNPLTSEEPWRQKGYRRMLAGNYLIYYLVDDGEMSVTVAAVLWRDQAGGLAGM